jgi:hypothetical protein
MTMKFDNAMLVIHSDLCPRRINARAIKVNGDGTASFIGIGAFARRWRNIGIDSSLGYMTVERGGAILYDGRQK